MTQKAHLLAALMGEPVERIPFGTVTSLATTEAMGRCGAAFPRVHRDAEAMAALAAFASLDAGCATIAPVFSVVHEAAALGAAIDWGQAEQMPAIVHPPWQRAEDIALPDDFAERESMTVICAALRLLRAQYGDSHVLVGKAFGPLSLSYHMFGVETVLIMSLEEPELLREIFARMLEVTIRSARAQLAAGADLLCIGDHCSRDMFSPETYRELLLPCHQELARRLPCPLVLHACGDTADRIELFAHTGFRAFHYDTRVPASRARALAGPHLALMGGVSNVTALLPGDLPAIRADVQRARAAGINIIGPECAIPLRTSLASLRAIAETLA